ncbi:MAG: hypothetical protein N4A35_06755 [Flavobacteriales bacterium]|jgi:hypothetical protein|nr:hypothetical protein [Flavobacteriales bacterium]
MNKKSILLIVGLIFDLIGMASYLIPALGEVIDFIWAPISGFALFIMYRGVKGVIGGVLGAVEEFLPGLDFIPSFTLMWFYTYYLQKPEEVQTIEK